MAEHTLEQPAQQHFFRQLIRWFNPVMTWLLQSRLHPLVSQSYMLIYVTGRHSGRQYQTPVQYGQKKELLYVITSRDYLWWRNLKGGGEVRLLLRGRVVPGEAHPVTDAAKIAAAATAVYPNLSPARMEALLPNCVGVVIKLRPPAGFVQIS